MRHIISLIEKITVKSLVGLEACYSIGLREYFPSPWYKDKIEEVNLNNVDSFSAIVLQDLTQCHWKKRKKVEYSGVSIITKVKVLMLESLFGDHNPQARKAMIVTPHYRLLKYPDSKGVNPSLILKIFNKKKKGVVSGSAALLGNHVFDNANYYHFWMDVIADIWYIKKNIPASEAPDYYLVPFASLDWQWDILNTCGLSESQVIPYDRYDLLSIEKLVIPIRDKGGVNLPPWLCHAIHDMCEWSPKAQRGQRLIYVSRADADRRRVVNEAAILERLRDKGFEVHTLNGLSLKEQQQLFSSAAIICAPHGAALTNLVWCGPGTVVIEFLSERHLVPCFRDLAAQNRLFYYPCICKQVGDVVSGIKGDVIVEDSQVESVLAVIDQYAPKHGDCINVKGEKC